MVGCIYKHTNTVTGKCYVGQTTIGMEKRWKAHCIEAKSGNLVNSKFHNSIRKYGVDKWKHEVIVNNIPIELLNDLEINCIAMESSFEDGYNTTAGGSATVGYRHSESAKENMGINRKGKFTGALNPMYGKKFTDEHRENISKKLKLLGCQKRPKSEEHKRKISESNLGKSGKSNPWYYITPDGTRVDVLISRHKWATDNGYNKHILNGKFSGKICSSGVLKGYMFCAVEVVA